MIGWDIWRLICDKYLEWPERMNMRLVCKRLKQMNPIDSIYTPAWNWVSRVKFPKLVNKWNKCLITVMMQTTAKDNPLIAYWLKMFVEFLLNRRIYPKGDRLLYLEDAYGGELVRYMFYAGLTSKRKRKSFY